ncbi:MAG: substrate-binding domain-containing protein [Chloroflexi bacterium]|nr:substrate-binding domain-containing protein [Chloroflexota bacterium]
MTAGITIARKRRTVGTIVMALAVAIPATTVVAQESASPGPESSAAPVYGDPVVGNGKKQWAWAIGLNELPIIQQMQKEMVSYSASHGWEVLFDSGTANQIQPMITSVQAWITAGVPAITVAPFEPTAFEPLAQQAVGNGLVWSAYAIPMDTMHAYVSFPPCDAAVLVADAAIAWIQANDPDAEVFITSNPANPAVACKWEDIQARIEAETDARVVAIQEGNNTVQALEATQAVLRANPNVTVVIGTNDDAAVGASQAFEAAGRDPAGVFIAGFDGSQEALEEIRDGGFIKATAALNLRRLARKVADTNMLLATTGQPAAGTPPLEVIEPPVLVMQGSPEIDEILAFYAE